jgi:hypothetical protein
MCRLQFKLICPNRSPAGIGKSELCRALSPIPKIAWDHGCLARKSHGIAKTGRNARETPALPGGPIAHSIFMRHRVRHRRMRGFFENSSWRSFEAFEPWRLAGCLTSKTPSSRRISKICFSCTRVRQRPVDYCSENRPIGDCLGIGFRNRSEHRVIDGLVTPLLHSGDKAVQMHRTPRGRSAFDIITGLGKRPGGPDGISACDRT